MSAWADIIGQKSSMDLNSYRFRTQTKQNTNFIEKLTYKVSQLLNLKMIDSII